MSWVKLTRALLLCWMFSWSFAFAEEVAIPPLSARVTDITGTLTSDQKATLEQSLADFEAQKGAQIAVLIIPSTGPEAIEQYSMRVVERWKLGRKKVDDGALLIIAKDDRTLRIEVGYGLEGALNDATSKRIISEVIIPQFKQGDYFGGVEAGIDSMMHVLSGEPLPAPSASGHGNTRSDLASYLPVLFIAVLAVGSIFRAVLGRFPGALVTGGVTAIIAWMLIGAFSIAAFAGVLALLLTLFGGGARGIGPGYYGGSGGSSSGGRDGFGGGGGGFGGGGASGRW